MKTSAICAAVVTAVFAGASGRASAGPLSQLYLTNGDANGSNNPGTTFVVQGGSIINQWTQQNDEYAIAVSGTVKQLGNGNAGYFAPFLAGSEYTLSGTFTGTSYPYPSPNALAFYDGATNGSSIYSANYKGGGVYQFDSNWANPTLLFSTPDQSLGITFDPTSGSLWLATNGATSLTNYSLTGTVLGGFGTPEVSGGITAVALDPADSTLWVYGGSSNTVYQYSLSGTFLGSQTYSGLGNVLGAEFAIIAPVPETSHVLLAAVAGLALVGFARRRFFAAA